MSRIHDLGGAHGFGPAGDRARRAAISPRMGSARLRDQPPPAARGVLHARRISRCRRTDAAAEYLAASYYEKWLHGIETLVREKGLTDVRDR